jgi:hypothetical protein
MLWSCDDDLFCVTVADGEHPGSPALADYCAGLSMEPAVRHPLLDAWLDNNVHPVTDLKFLDDRCYRRDPALS